MDNRGHWGISCNLLCMKCKSIVTTLSVFSTSNNYQIQAVDKPHEPPQEWFSIGGRYITLLKLAIARSPRFTCLQTKQKATKVGNRFRREKRRWVFLSKAQVLLLIVYNVIYKWLLFYFKLLHFLIIYFKA